MKSPLLPHSVRSSCLTFLASLFITFAAPLLGYSAPQQYIEIDQIGNDHLIYLQYDLSTQPQRVDLSDLILSDKIIGKPVTTPINTLWTSKPDFKLILLSAGLARLKDFDSAPEKYKVAQEKARTEGKGDWAKPPATSPSASATPVRTPPPQPSSTPEEPSVFSQISSDLYSLGKTLWYWVISPLGTLGIMGVVSGAILTYLYRRFYIQRRLRLLIIGESYSGKSALYLRLLNPNISEETILNLSPTAALQEMVRRDCIPYGKYEIYPRYKDVPGSAPATIWDELIGFKFLWFRTPHAIVVTLATTIERGGAHNNKAQNQSFLDTQLGWVRAILEGSMGAGRTRKPKLIILYLNKFDLFSSQPPTDTNVAATSAQFTNIFAEHIKSAKKAAKKAGIDCPVVVGSALKNWNCEEVVKIVGRVLYDS